MEIEEKLKLIDSMDNMPKVLLCAMVLTLFDGIEHAKNKKDKYKMDKSLDITLKGCKKIIFKLGED